MSLGARRFYLPLLLAAVPPLHAQDPIAPPPNRAQSRQVVRDFGTEVTTQVSLRYVLYLPPTYAEEGDSSWPLLLFLHGAGERGTDLMNVAIHGPPKLIEEGRRFPFAAVVPVSGGGNPVEVCRLKDTAVWIFHGADDPVIPVEAARPMAGRLERCGGKVRLSVFPGVGHDAWTGAYADDGLYEWLLEQRRTSE